MTAIGGGFGMGVPAGFSLAGATRGIARGEQGVIIVPAVVMGAILVGALFYVAGIGDAILFRTQMQDAADVTAFKGAVWHARGMNTIVVINALMSLALAVFALLRIAEIACLLLALASVWAPPVAAAALNMARTLYSYEDRVFRVVDGTLKVMKPIQESVAATVPVISASAVANTDTAADSITPFSLSLLPVMTDARMDYPERMAGNLAPVLPSLPVQDDSFGKLCNKAGTLIPRQIEALLNSTGIPGVGKAAGLAIDFIGGTLFEVGDGAFCQPLNGGIWAALSGAWNTASNAMTCEEAQEESDDYRDGQSEEKRDDRADYGCDAPEQDRAGLFDTKPAKVWDPAANGNVFLHSWTWVEGTPKLFGRDKHLMSLADPGREPEVEAEPEGTAMAEYYFDCEGGWNSNEDDCRWEAMWRPSWTARMRRFRTPLEELAGEPLRAVTDKLDFLQSSVGDHVGDIIGDRVRSATGISGSGSGLSGWIGDAVNSIPGVQQVNDVIDGAVGFVREDLGLDSLLDLSNLVQNKRIH